MNDWWNDPPEGPEEQTCEKCDGFGEVAKETGEQIVFLCFECGHEWTVKQAAEPDPPEEVVRDDDDVPEVSVGKCPHGNKWGDCGACDYASDIAYDAARESRMR